MTEDVYKIKSFYHIIPTDKEELYFKSFNRFTAIKGKSASLIKEIVTALKNRKTLSALSQELSIHKEDLQKICDILLQRGFITKISAAEDELKQHKNEIDYISYFTSDFNPEKSIDFLKKILESDITIISNGTLGRKVAGNLFSNQQKVRFVDFTRYNSEEPILKLEATREKAACNEYHALIKDEKVLKDIIAKSDLVVIASDTPINPMLLSTVNRLCLDTGKTWLMVYMDGLRGHVGPTFIPKETACFTCLSQRFKSNVENFKEYEMFDEYLASETNYDHCTPHEYHTTALSGLVSYEILRILSSFDDPVSFNKELTIDFTTFETGSETVLKLPRCSSCGTGNFVAPKNKYIGNL